MSQDEDSWTPSDFVVPVLGVHEDGGNGPFLGSGVFVGEKAILVTCHHVLDGWEGEYGVVIEAEDRLVRAEVITREPSTDLALLGCFRVSPTSLRPCRSTGPPFTDQTCNERYASRS